MLALFVAGVGPNPSLRAQSAPPSAPKAPNAILINNARVFNGVSDELKPGNLLIVGSKIKQMDSGPITPPAGSQIIDAGAAICRARVEQIVGSRGNFSRKAGHLNSRS